MAFARIVNAGTWATVLLSIVGLSACAEESTDNMGPTAGSVAGGGGTIVGAGGASGMSTGGRAGSTTMPPRGGAGVGGSGGMIGASGRGGRGASGMGSGGAGGADGAAGASGGSGGTGGMGGAGGSGGAGGAGGSSGATFTQVYSIIMMKCGGGQSGCHVTGQSGMLRMPNKSTAHMNLVGVDSEECDGEKRVIAGDPQNSLLVKAIEGRACVDRMPDGRDPLSANEISTIRAWIMAGAMNN